MSNLHPFLKKSERDLIYELDFRYALDDNLSKEPINEIIRMYAETNVVKPAHYLIHRCSHFYGEGKHSINIMWAKDFNLIKLCDVREYIIQFTIPDDLIELITFAKKIQTRKTSILYNVFF